MAGFTGLLPKNTYGDIINTGNGGAGVSATMKQVQDGLGNNTGLFLSTTQIGIAGTDVGMKRIAAAVAAMTDGGGTNLGWLQEAGYAALAGNFTTTSTAMAATNLSFNVISGRSYQLSGCIFGGNGTAAQGANIDFNGGAATMTTFLAALTFAGTTVAGTTVSTALATAIGASTFTTTSVMFVSGYLKPSSTATFIMRAAANNTGGATLTINAGSWLCLTDAVAL